LQFRGALNLASLPWVFVTSDTVGTEQRFDLVGQGTHRVREPEALVAVADAWAVQPEADSICELIGATQKLDENRKVYRLSGAASFSNAGTRCRIATSDPQATAAADYRLFGRRLDLGRGNPPVFRGLPSIMRSSPSGVDSPTPRHEVQWRSAQASSPWLPLSERCYGDGQLRHVVDGAEQFRTRVRIAPRSLAIRFQPDGAEAGAILFEGGDGLSVACNSAEGVIWSAERLNGTVTMRLRATRGVPSSVTAQLVWGVGARLELVLPFPANQVGFVALDGNRIDSGSTITVGQLSGISALAMVPRARRAYRIECTIVTARFGGAAARRAFVSYPMTESSLGMHTFDLGALQDSVLEQLSASDDLDCAVRVSIHGDRSDDAIPSLLVRRYDLQFVADLDESTLRIPASLLVGRIPSQVSSLHVEAVSLISPDSETVVLERIGKSEWSLDNPYLTPGPWLILGWSGEWCRARPRLFEAQRAQTPVSAPRRPADGLAAACTIADRFDRRKAITASIRNLAQDPDHDDWQLLRAHVRLTKDVSPSTFDTICCLVENSAACALGALVLPEDEPELFDTYWSALRLLPFSWLAVPGVVWREAMKTWLTVRRDALRGLGLDSAMAVNMVNAQRYESAKRNLTGEGRLTWLVPALEMARNAALGISSSRESIAVRQGLMNDQCLTMYFGAIAQLPAAPLDGRDPLPPTYHLNKRLSLLGSGRAQRLRVDPSRMPGVVGDARSAFLNAPAIAAVAAVAGEFLDTEAQLDLRAAYDHDRSWFGEAYNWAYLYMSALD
jgi:hypothetical protein